MDWIHPTPLTTTFSQQNTGGVAISFSRGPSRPRDQTCVSYTDRQILYHWATWEAPNFTEVWLTYDIILVWYVKIGYAGVPHFAVPCLTVILDIVFSFFFFFFFPKLKVCGHPVSNKSIGIIFSNICLFNSQHFKFFSNMFLRVICDQWSLAWTFLLWPAEGSDGS